MRPADARTEDRGAKTEGRRAKGEDRTTKTDGREEPPTFRVFEQMEHPQIVYESGKCIACGLCIRIAHREGEKLGLAFIGRGFDVRVGVPFGKSLAEALTKSALACAAACPTGALAEREAL